MTQRVKLDVWVVVGEDGDYTVSERRENAMDLFRDEISMHDIIGVHHIYISVPLPERSPPHTVNIPDNTDAEIIAGLEQDCEE